MSLPYTQTRWSLADLFPGFNSPELEQAFTDLEAKVADFEALRPQLSPDISTAELMNFVTRLEAINELGGRLYAFAGLSFSADTQDQAAQTLVARVDQFLANLQNRILFFSLWWKELDDENAARLMTESGDYRYWLEEMRHFKPHTLTEPEEKVINIKNVTGANALGNLYDSITNRYTFKVAIDGEVKVAGKIPSVEEIKKYMGKTE